MYMCVIDMSFSMKNWKKSLCVCVSVCNYIYRSMQRHIPKGQAFKCFGQ